MTASRPDPAAVRTVTCAGTGVIGGGWVAYFLAKGYDVVAWDPAPGAEQRLRHLVDVAWPALTRLGRRTARRETGSATNRTSRRRSRRPSSCRRVRRRTSS